MDWLQNLLAPGASSLPSTIILYAFVIAAGVWLGKLKVGGISLGVTFVLFVGLLMGHFGYIVNPDVLHFVREFGLILFIFSIGLQVGPSFFSSFKRGGVVLNGLAALTIALNVVIVLAIFYIDGNTSITALVGVMSGAVTNTPGLGAAQQAILQVMPQNYNATEEMAMGYAAAYPLGVVGIITAMFLVRALFRVKMDKEVEAIEAEKEAAQQKPLILTYEVTNPLIDGKNMMQLHDIVNCDFVVSRLQDKDGNIFIPNSQTVVHKGDKLYTVLSANDEERFKSVIGPELDIDWESNPGPVVSRRILITKTEYNGVTLGSLKLRHGYSLNATRVNRAGIDLLASPDLRLQMGDRITVVGQLEDIRRLAEKLGNSVKRLNEPNMFTLFAGIFLGIIVGSIPIAFPGISVPMKLGMAGGPLVVAILLSRFGYKLKLVTYTSSAASLLMREIGICLFLASVGIAAGANFASTVFNYTGMWWVIWGFIITFVPLVVVGSIARGVYKINMLTVMGLFGGSMTDPPALAFANNSTGNDAPAVAYSTVYPLTMFLRIVAAQVLVLALAS
ncbi:putative transporter [Muribaculum intestinale]|jgi:putative transport protein|uniref:Transporter n=1 Tax=Muribaculum intestinale TaxID=1796646 RepID=A0A1B1SAG1_9BACT|nr:putative transporter [Muribaculum intestinale]ROS82966.1 putative transporter [Muribaculaceae bacterium Isolate-042 (Harlan)]ROT07878.1 putative transporter [Muribaculaceae bacterium Isolate-100 (HZI)]RXE66442.1 putative transporter [Muribaculaceae bacterium Isolate-007 (NCI)]GFI67122.1 aspartate/alanine antiporter [Muribaculaceae bacterium]ANU63789.1 transporter [Muribaculum intestinale]